MNLKASFLPSRHSPLLFSHPGLELAAILLRLSFVGITTTLDHTWLPGL